jgi:hypothetical protein
VTTGLAEAEISGALDDFEHEPDSAVQIQWQKRDLEVEDGVSRIQSELSRRLTLMGPAYPFTLSGATLTYSGPTADLVYEFCLAISCAPTVSKGEYVHLTRTFERVVAIIAALILGNDAQSLHVGAPRDADVGLSFKDAMETLHRLTQEFNWNPLEAHLVDDPATNGDEGVDFVAWESPGDLRPGRIVVLGQCACGNTIEDKYDDVNVRKFLKWFGPVPTLDPIRAFATPRHVPDINLKEAQREAGLVLDRARLSLIATGAAKNSQVAKYAQRMSDLIKLVVEAA